MQRKIGVVVIAHGSRHIPSNERLLQMVRTLRERTSATRIEMGFLERGEPLIPAAIEKLLQQGCTHLHGFALFLAPGRHLSEDVPALFRQTLDPHPGVTWDISPALLDDPGLLVLVEARLRRIFEAVDTAPIRG